MLTIDIETYKTDDQSIINYTIAGKKREDYKQSALEKLATNPHTGKIILIGMLTDQPIGEGVLWEAHPHPEGDDATEQINIYQTLIGLAGLAEYDILKYAWRVITEELDRGGQIITFKGKTFDIPYLIRRSMILNVQPANRRDGTNIYYPFDLIKKYDTSGHLDLFEKLTVYGETFVSLDMWAYAMGIVTNFGSSGSDVGEWFEKGEFDKIKEHCSEDLWKTFYVYERMKPWLT